MKSSFCIGILWKQKSAKYKIFLVRHAQNKIKIYAALCDKSSVIEEICCIEKGKKIRAKKMKLSRVHNNCCKAMEVVTSKNRKTSTVLWKSATKKWTYFYETIVEESWKKGLEVRGYGPWKKHRFFWNNLDKPWAGEWKIKETTALLNDAERQFLQTIGALESMESITKTSRINQKEQLEQLKKFWATHTNFRVSALFSALEYSMSTKEECLKQSRAYVKISAIVVFFWAKMRINMFRKL